MPAIGADELKSPETIRATFAELLATMFFVFVGVGSIAAFVLTGGGGGIVLIAVAHGLAIALLVAGIGPISGGHINPAVTFAMIITNRVTVTRGLMYIAAQMVGAVIGAALLKVFLEGALLDSIPGAGGHGVADDAVNGTLAAMGIEAFLTGLLVWTVFSAGVHPHGNHIIAPLAIGFAVLVIHLVAIPITGAGVNPARTFGPALMGVGGGNDIGVWDDWWVYYVGPLLGGAVAALLFYYLYLMDVERADALETTPEHI
jgi:MIP family channel proteins